MTYQEQGRENLKEAAALRERAANGQAAALREGAKERLIERAEELEAAAKVLFATDRWSKELNHV